MSGTLVGTCKWRMSKTVPSIGVEYKRSEAIYKIMDSGCKYKS